MSERYDIPENDPDADLARRIGDALARGDDPAAAAPDPLLGPLAEYRDAAQAQRPASDIRDRNWAHIAAQMTPAQERRAPLRLVVPTHRKPVVFGLALAASLALLIAVGVWLWTASPEEVMVAFAKVEPVTYTTADGSTVTLRSHSALYQIDADEAHFRLEGEAFFAVTHNPDRPFSVEAGEAVVTVLGTQFNVSTWGEVVSVFLQEGRVRFAGGEEAVVLEPGQRAVLAADALVAPTAAEAEDYLDWMSGAMSFTNVPLRDLLDELAHHYGLRLTAPDTLLNETLTGRIPLSSPQQSLADLGTVLGGRFVPAGDGTYRFEQE